MPPWVLAAEWAFVVLTLAYALWRGDGAVRAAALIFALTELGVVALESFTAAGKPAYLYVDLPGLALLVALTLRAPRPWLVWACAFRFVIIGTHVGFGIDSRIEDAVYLHALNTWLMLAYGTLLWGATQANRRRRADRGAQAA